MKTKTTIIAGIILIALNLVLILLLYPELPDYMITHWDINGNPNGYMDKPAGILFVPIISIILFVVLLFVPRFDPYFKNIKKFEGTFNIFVIGFLLFLFYVNDITLLSNLGFSINTVQLMMPAMAGFTYLLGHLVANAESNYTIGIRTPWTLNDKTTWDKTHKLGGKLFKYAALASLIGIIFPQIGLMVSFFSIIGVSLFLVIYSYKIYRRKKEK